MALAPGTRIGPYEVLTPLGAGGMGEVYRARDAKLGRDVAIKVLPDSLAHDPERLARFEREAKTLAALNHPHIAHIHGFEDSTGTPALVMELVEGPTLADRIAKGPIPIDEALPIAKQIAEALEAAHEQGIIHRDLKPANIKVRADGTVKLLDFGLAKALDPATSSSPSATMSPTLSIHATQAGIILGTAAYMSPEQARGAPVDRRADIWAFGVVLFEMLIGRRVFEGDGISDTLASVLKTEPDWNALAADVRPTTRRLLMLCLKKDPRARLRDIGEARRQIEEMLGGATEELAQVLSSRSAVRWRRMLPWAIAAMAVLVSARLATRNVDRAEPMSMYASLDAPADYVLGEDDAIAPLPTRTPMVFTSDGRSLVIQAAQSGKPRLVLRSLDRPDLRPIEGTDDARVPFVSPDGKWIGFWSANELKKVPLEGGTPTPICALPSALGPNGVAWGPGDIIVFGDDASGRIMRVSANGGTPMPVSEQPQVSLRKHVTPSFLSDGHRVLYADVSIRDAGDARLMVQSLDGGVGRLMIASATDGRVLPSGDLVFMRLGTLMTVAFDPARAQVKGAAVVAMGGVMQSGLLGRAGAVNTGAGMFAISSRGTLAVIRGGLIGADENHLTWASRDGRMTSAEPKSGAPAGSRNYVRISPDGMRAAVTVQTPMRREMWLADWTRDGWTLCGDCASESSLGIWSFDGRRVLISRSDTLVSHSIDAALPDEIVAREAGRSLTPGQWLRDGTIVYSSSPDLANYEIKVIDAGRGVAKNIVPLGALGDPDISPDGRWLAYTSRTQDGGQLNVVVQAFPGPGARTQVSAGRAMNPKWSTDGRTLYYMALDPSPRDQALFSVTIDTAHGITAGKPSQVIAHLGSQTCTVRCFDVSPDGQRFLFRLRPERRASATRMDIVQNWNTPLSKNR